MTDTTSPEERLRHDLAIARRIAIDAGAGQRPALAAVLQVYEFFMRERERGRYALPALDPYNALIQHLALDTSKGSSRVRRLLLLVKKQGQVPRVDADRVLGSDSWIAYEAIGARCARHHVDFRTLIWTDRTSYYVGPALEYVTVPWSARGARLRRGRAAARREAEEE